jgi:hypothetical protein
MFFKFPTIFLMVLYLIVGLYIVYILTRCSLILIFTRIQSLTTWLLNECEKYSSYFAIESETEDIQ